MLSCIKMHMDVFIKDSERYGRLLSLRPTLVTIVKDKLAETDYIKS